MTEFALQYGFLAISLIAGVLTVLSPCVLPILPIVISGSANNQKRSLWKPLRIIIALALSIIIFSILLKATTTLLGVPDIVWKLLSGGILVLFGIFLFFPKLWDQITDKLGFKKSSNKLLSSSFNKNGILGDLVIGVSLGPVFSSCSPTYLIIVATIIPQSWSVGLIYLFAFVLGLSVILILIATLGQKLISKLKILNSLKFKRILAVIFIIVGLSIMTGFDKKVESYLVEQGLYDWLIEFEGQHNQLE